MRTIGVVLLAGAAMAQAPSYQVVASTSAIMRGMIEPAEKAILEASKEAPADNRAWGAVRTQSMLMQEGAQLLEMGSRAKDQDGWIKASQALFDAAGAVTKAAQARDAAAFTEAASHIAGTCKGCHDTYRPARQPKKQ
jgi:cytochrome c556